MINFSFLPTKKHYSQLDQEDFKVNFLLRLTDDLKEECDLKNITFFVDMDTMMTTGGSDPALIRRIVAHLNGNTP